MDIHLQNLRDKKEALTAPEINAVGPFKFLMSKDEDAWIEDNGQKVWSSMESAADAAKHAAAAPSSSADKKKAKKEAGAFAKLWG